jgi:hypothetical protein
VFFFEQALSELSAPQFALVMQRFLAITRTHPLNYAMVLTSGLVPFVALVSCYASTLVVARSCSPCWVCWRSGAGLS